MYESDWTYSIILRAFLSSVLYVDARASRDELARVEHAISLIVYFLRCLKTQ